MTCTTFGRHFDVLDIFDISSRNGLEMVRATGLEKALKGSVAITPVIASAYLRSLGQPFDLVSLGLGEKLFQ